MDETMQAGLVHICPRGKRAEEDMGTARIDEVLTLLHGINDRLVRIETLVDLHLGKEGTLERLTDRVDGMNTRVLLLSGAMAGGIQLLRFLGGFIK